MQPLDYWKLCDELNIIQAALLILDLDPAKNEDYIMQWEPQHLPEGFSAIFAALKGAVSSKALPATVMFSEERTEYDYMGETRTAYIPSKTPDWNLMMIKVQDLKQWLLNHNLMPDFFFPDGVDHRNYLDPNNQFYAPKLAAAVKSWEAVTSNPNNLKKMSPRKALEKWLRENAAQFGLTKEDGSHNEQGIEQISKVANWKPEGGATKTPSGVSMNLTTPLQVAANTDNFSTDEDETAIPF